MIEDDGYKGGEDMVNMMLEDVTHLEESLNDNSYIHGRTFQGYMIMEMATLCKIIYEETKQNRSRVSKLIRRAAEDPK